MKFLLKRKPVPEKYASYREYLQSPHWKRLRKQKLAEANYRCQVCNASTSQLDVHHRTYQDLGHEKLIDLTVLCRECHQLFHDHGKLRY